MCDIIVTQTSQLRMINVFPISPEHTLLDYLKSISMSPTSPKLDGVNTLTHILQMHMVFAQWHFSGINDPSSC